MVNNRIKNAREDVGLTQRDVAAKMPDQITPSIFCYIEGGRVLPTREGLAAICETLSCEPEDLYDPRDLRIADVGAGDIQKQGSTSERRETHVDGVSTESGSDAISGERSDSARDHSGKVEFRTWLRANEKSQLEQAVVSLGYRSMSEWFREAYRSLIARAKRSA